MFTNRRISKTRVARLKCLKKHKQKALMKAKYVDLKPTMTMLKLSRWPGQARDTLNRDVQAWNKWNSQNGALHKLQSEVELMKRYRARACSAVICKYKWKRCCVFDAYWNWSEMYEHNTESI